jgi:chemotaxis response regulator CheB
VCTVLYIARSPGRSQIVSDILARFSAIEPMCFAADGLEALTLTNLFKPDVVLLDASLEKVGGREVARTLTQTRKTLKIVIVEESFNPAELLAILEEIIIATSSSHL